MTDTPRIYVASLSDYNSGRLHGAWIDANQEPEYLAEDVAAMLALSTEPGAEEYAIHDYEGFEGLAVSEYETLKNVSLWATAIVEHGPAFAAYVANHGAEYASVDGFEEDYCGEWESEAAFAEELADDLEALPNVADLPWPAVLHRLGACKPRPLHERLLVGRCAWVCQRVGWWAHLRLSGLLIA